MDYVSTGIMNVGSEANAKQADPKKHKRSTTNRLNAIDVAWYRCISWLGGLFVSLIPAAACPFFKYISTDSTFLSFVYSIFSQGQTLFIAISLCITSNNDAASIKSCRILKYWHIAMWFLLIACAVLFSGMSISEAFVETHSVQKSFEINCVLLVITILFGSIPYIISICKAYEEDTFSSEGATMHE